MPLRARPECELKKKNNRINCLIPTKLSREQLLREAGRHEDTDTPLRPPSEGALFLPAGSFLGHMAPAGNLLGCLHVPHREASRAGHEAAYPTGSEEEEEKGRITATRIGALRNINGLLMGFRSSLRVVVVDSQSTTQELGCQGNLNKNNNLSRRHNVATII